MFIWWMLSKLWYTTDKNAQEWIAAVMFGTPMIELLVNVLIFGVRSPDPIWFPVSITLWGVSLLLGIVMFFREQYLEYQHYLQDGQTEKPKRWCDE